MPTSVWKVVHEGFGIELGRVEADTREEAVEKVRQLASRVHPHLVVVEDAALASPISIVELG